MRSLLLVIPLLFAPAFTAAAPTPADERIQALERRVGELESRLAAAPPPVAPTAPPAPPAPPDRPPPPSQPLDMREPTFGEFDFSWMNGNNPQPASLLGMGPLTWSLYVDTYFAWQFHQPADHTIFPTTTAPRHNEISLNLAHIGVDLTGLDGPIGRLYLQYGSIVETIAGQDTTTTRGFFLTNRLLQYVQQASVGWHFHALHGINVELGIFQSYIGLESYLPEENWAYTHAMMADATPYYFFGLRSQLFLSRRFKLELWLVNGWQTFGQWHEARAGGYLWNWRPRAFVSLVNALYLGQEAQSDPDSLRVYTDNNLQIRYYQGSGRYLRSLAFSLVADFGWEHRGNAPSGAIAGVTLTHHFDFSVRWKGTVRGDILYDQTQAISPKFPVGAAYRWPDTGAMLVGGISATIDCWPSPWILTRLEYSHREANQPLFSGPGGITGPGGLLPSPATVPTFTPDLSQHDDRLILNVTLRL
jgi:hypothetical protein